MSNVLLAGLADQEAAAAEIMVDMAWHDARCIVLRRSPNLTLPEQSPAARACEHCVVDLFGIGLRRFTPEHAQQLLDFLDGRSAVVLAWGHGEEGWMGRALNLGRGQLIEWLSTPYTSQDLRAALSKVRAVPRVQAGQARKDQAAAPARTSFLRPNAADPTPPAAAKPTRTSFLRPGAAPETPPAAAKPARPSFLRPNQEQTPAPTAPAPTRPSFLRPGSEVPVTPAAAKPGSKPASTPASATPPASPAKSAPATRPSLLRPGTVVPVAPTRSTAPQTPPPARTSFLRPGPKDEAAPPPTQAASAPPTAKAPSPPPAAPAPPAPGPAAAKPAAKQPPAAKPASAEPVPAAPPLATVAPSAVAAKEADKAPGLSIPVRPKAAEPVAAAHPMEPMEPGVGLLNGAYPALVAAFPELDEHEFFKLIERVIAIKGPVLMNSRETSAGVTAFVIDVRQGWVASKMPAAVLTKVANTPSLLKCVNVSPLAPLELDAELRQRFGDEYASIQRPLDHVCWILGESVLKQYPPTLRGDLRFRLRRTPNFTALGKVDTFEIQLAAICSRMPQSVLDLQRAFPNKDPIQIERFVILSILSGAGIVLSKASTSKTRAAAAQPEQKARRGFFKSLLDKLF